MICETANCNGSPAALRATGTLGWCTVGSAHFLSAGSTVVSSISISELAHTALHIHSAAEYETEPCNANRSPLSTRLRPISAHAFATQCGRLSATFRLLTYFQIHLSRHIGLLVSQLCPAAPAFGLRVMKITTYCTQPCACLGVRDIGCRASPVESMCLALACPLRGTIHLLSVMTNCGDCIRDPRVTEIDTHIPRFLRVGNVAMNQLYHFGVHRIIWECRSEIP